MRPVIKRTIHTSKETGRRYFVARSASRNRPRRYYVCREVDCDRRLLRDTDTFCRLHAQSNSGVQETIAETSAKSDDMDDDLLDDQSELVDDEYAVEDNENPTSGNPQNDDEPMGDNHSDNHESTTEEDYNDVGNVDPTMSSTPTTFLSKKRKYNREIEVDQITGTRSFRDQTGRRRFLCMKEPCTVMLKRQSDAFCRKHSPFGSTNVDFTETNSRTDKRHSAPSTSEEAKHSSRSQLSTTSAVLPTPENTNGSSSDQYQTVKPVKRQGTTRSFRDASGRIRFLCSNPTCTRRVPRQSETFCKKHQPDQLMTELPKEAVSVTAKTSTKQENGNKTVQQMDVTYNSNNISSQSVVTPSFTQKNQMNTSTSNFVSIPVKKIVLSTTTLLDDQWSDVLQFVRNNSNVQLSTNLNVNNSTTHLLIDDSENFSHCIITKKIVQAAVRRDVFIISVRWISECLRTQTFVDEHPYEIKSDTHTALRPSKQDFQINSKYLFDRDQLKLTYGFAIECRQCQGSINRNELIELIELSGAKLFENDNTMDMLIVLCDINEKSISKIKEKYLNVAPTIKFVTSDFLLKSIIKFEIQDVDKYIL